MKVVKGVPFYTPWCNWSNSSRIDGKKATVNQVDFDKA